MDSSTIQSAQFVSSIYEGQMLARAASAARVAEKASIICRALQRFAPGILPDEVVALDEALKTYYDL